MDVLVKQRGLKLNRDKSVCVIIGSKKQKLEASMELEVKPLKCGEFCTKEKQEEKWLGQYISGLGLADSVAKTVEAREGKIKGACMEIASIVNDWRATVAGGMETALLLWEACCIPSLLHGAGTWVDMSRETERRPPATLPLKRMHQPAAPGTPAPLVTQLACVVASTTRLALWTVTLY